ADVLKQRRRSARRWSRRSHARYLDVEVFPQRGPPRPKHGCARERYSGKQHSPPAEAAYFRTRSIGRRSLATFTHGILPLSSWQAKSSGLKPPGCEVGTHSLDASQPAIVQHSAVSSANADLVAASADVGAID